MLHSTRFGFAVVLSVVVAGVLSVAGGGCHPQRADDADGGANVDGGDGSSLVITPAGGALTVTDLTALPSLTLTATYTAAGGSAQTVPASWSLDRYDIAQVGGSSGVVTAAGAAFGTVKVTASAMGLTATADVVVDLKLVINDANASPTGKTQLDGATVTDSVVAGLQYPYDKTVFPRALLAPELMWKGGSDADLYSLHFVAKSFDLTIYTTAVNPSRYPIPQPLWTALGATAAGSNVAFELHRLDIGGHAYVSAKQTWTIANAVLRGTIYYWAIDQGQIVQLDVSTGTRKLAFDSGPYDQLGTPMPSNVAAPATPVWENNGGGKRCVACHAVSKDGSRLGAVFARAGSAGPFGSVSLATGTTTTLGDYQSSMVFTTLTPDGSVAAVNYGDKSVHLLDAATSAPIASTLDTMTNLCDPTFSPDGLHFAVSSNCDPGFGYPVEFRRADLTVYDYDPATHVFSNPKPVLVSSGVGDAIAFANFSPDSKLVFYQRGDYSRAKYNEGPAFKHGADDLFVSPVAASAAAIPLDAANGKGVLPPDSLHLNYAPTVNPIAEGGYIWVVFTSPRDYGNRMLSPQQAVPKDATWSNRKQLWVAAVDVATGAVDPSHPAFWLPGQDLATVNMFGYWSLSPCKPTLGGASMPNSCSAGFECCSGFCRDSGNGPVCVDAPSGCHQVGEKCTVAADCCNADQGIACVAGICQGTQIL